jgi:hypothetical protein
MHPAMEDSEITDESSLRARHFTSHGGVPMRLVYFRNVSLKGDE